VEYISKIDYKTKKELDSFATVLFCLYSFFVLEVEDALPGESEELFEISNSCLSPKHGGFPDILGSFKFEADNQKLEPTCFDNESKF